MAVSGAEREGHSNLQAYPGNQMEMRGIREMMAMRPV